MTVDSWVGIATLAIAVIGGAMGIASAFGVARSEGRITRAILDAGMRNMAEKFEDFARTNERLFELHERRMETLDARIRSIEKSVASVRELFQVNQ